ncbi:hypothetical protein [Streptomyces anulatus]|uniref:hypothetical protein n=1 Tax=Streptomyces anulatus TaxID=1892 RepID=UPI003867F862
MKTPPHEVLTSDTTLLTFDGRVLELFGFGDVHRLPVRQEPRLEFATGRKPTMAVTRGQPGAPRDCFPARPGASRRSVRLRRATRG